MAFVTELNWLEDGEVASQVVLNRPLLELVGNDIILQNNKVDGAASSTINGISLFSDETGKVIKNSAVTISESGTISLPEGQSIMVGAKAYASSTRFMRWMGV